MKNALFAVAVALLPAFSPAAFDVRDYGAKGNGVQHRHGGYGNGADGDAGLHDAGTQGGGAQDGCGEEKEALHTNEAYHTWLFMDA